MKSQIIYSKFLLWGTVQVLKEFINIYNFILLSSSMLSTHNV